jgi:CheY-like chemotaxis protein
MSYTVVAIEDEDEIIELLRVVLRHAAITVRPAYSGQSGLALVREIVPDLVMLDIMMPGMDGWTVYDAIRADPNLRDVPVIILSVLQETPERKRAFASSDIDLYVTKPFDTVTLRHEIGRLLGDSELWE